MTPRACVSSEDLEETDLWTLRKFYPLSREIVFWMQREEVSGTPFSFEVSYREHVIIEKEGPVLLAARFT